MRDADVAGRSGRAEQRRTLQQRMPDAPEERGQSTMRSTPYGLTQEFGRQRSPQRANVPQAPSQPDPGWGHRAQPERGRSFGTQ